MCLGLDEGYETRRDSSKLSAKPSSCQGIGPISPIVHLTLRTWPTWSKCCQVIMDSTAGWEQCPLKNILLQNLPGFTLHCPVTP